MRENPVPIRTIKNQSIQHVVCSLQGVRTVNAEPTGAGTYGGSDEDFWEGTLAGLLTILHYIRDPEAATHTYNPNVQEIEGRKIRLG